MSTGENIKWPGGTQDKGLNTFEPSIGSEISWSNEAVNISGGMKRGASPRYGIAPMAGHSNTETPAGTNTNGIQRSEITTGSVGLIYRKHIYAIYPITMAPYDGSYPKNNLQYYLYLVGLDDGSNISIDACLGTTVSSSVYKQESTIVAGLAASSYRQESPLVRLHKTSFLNLPLDATPTAADMQGILRQVANRYWMPTAHISVSGKRVSYQWMFGAKVGEPTLPNATNAPGINLWASSISGGTNPTVLGGSPSEIITREFISNDQRLLSMYCLDGAGYPMDLAYTQKITQANTQSVPAYASGRNYLNLTGATKTGASTAYSSIRAALLNDPGSYTNTRHDAVLIAGLTPFAVVYQDWLQAVKGMMPRWVDLTNPGCIPRSGLCSARSSLFGIGNEGNPSGFSPNAQGVLPLVGDTGFLSANKVYELGFSYYNKLLDYETNVVFAQAFSSTTDKYAIIVDYSTSATDNIWEMMQTSSPSPGQSVNMPWEFSNTASLSGAPVGRGMHINDYQIRFYYRERPNNEWLPCGQFDASQYWFSTSWNSSNAGGVPLYGPVVCVGASGYSVGGQPNGYNDYSPLPKQTYICTQVFQNRAFWWSEKSMHFSVLNNIYAYPTRNIVSATTGKWRGGIVHTRINQNIQQSRLVVFGDVVYSCRFTGELSLQAVRVSENTQGQFAVDGSDFRMEYLCEATAFSYRSACVGEGVLYWWGPQGIYRDDGITEPKKISLILDSDNESESIFNWVDMGRDQEVHAVYNKRTHEICWFYPPKVTDADFPTYGLIYNLENGQFYHYKFRCQVDASQTIQIENDSSPDDIDGPRVLLHCRATASDTVQRTFYFDQLVKAGEQGPNRELTVFSFTSPTTDTRRLVLAAGSVGITAGGITVDDYISIQNAKGYAPSLTLAQDMIAKIVGVNNASNYIDIELPPGAVFDASATLTGKTAFPIYHRKPTTAGLHGITYLLDTNYWLPDGLSSSWYWQYIHFLFKYAGIPSPRDPFSRDPLLPESVISRINFAYQTLRGDAAASILPLINNSRDHCQILHQLSNDERSANGQALKFSLSGIHIGDPWSLEYLEAHCLPERGYTPKEFET